MKTFLIMEYMLLFFGLTVCLSIHSQEKKLKIKFAGKEYTTLSLSFNMENDKKIRILGNMKDKIWTFTFNDSIEDKMRFMSLHDIEEEKLDTLSIYIVMFEYFNDKNEKCVLPQNFQIDSLTVIDAAYVETKKIPGCFIQNSKGTIVVGNIVQDVFLMPYEQGEQMIKVPFETSGFSAFPSDTTKSYKDYLAEYEVMAKQYVQATTLPRSLYANLHKFRSKEDIVRIYNCFSENNKHSYYGEKINRYLNGLFKNSVLYCPGKKDTTEYIVQSPDKFNLLIFSASWCLPCIKEIPLLKKIYADLGDKLIMTYISIDDKKDEPRWLKLIKENEIPWRSLCTREKRDEIKELYSAMVIPTVILIYPNGRMEYINVREVEQLAKLYQIFGKNA